MASREHLPELRAEIHEIEGGAAQGQSGPIGSVQARRQICGRDGHPASIRRGRRRSLPLATRRRTVEVIERLIGVVDASDVFLDDPVAV